LWIFTYKVCPRGPSINAYLLTFIGCEPETIQNIQQEYANALNFCDGDIFRHLRYAQKEGSLAKQGRWIARLSKQKWEAVRRLQTKDSFKALNQAFDSLLDYEGLWPALQIGNLHKILAMQCPEVSRSMGQNQGMLTHYIGISDLLTVGVRNMETNPSGRNTLFGLRYRTSFANA